MKKTLLAIVIIIFTQTLFSQSEIKEISNIYNKDSLYVISDIIDDVFIGTDIKHYPHDCYLENKIYLPEKSKIFIAGKRLCKDRKFYVVYYKGEKYYIEPEDIFITPNDIDFFNNLDDTSKVIYERKIKEYAESFYNKQVLSLTNFFNIASKQDLIILNKRLYNEGEYFKGKSFDITVFNPSKKIIKYITFTIVGYNAVNDKVGNPLVQKCIGPINPGDRGNYIFEYLWTTTIVKTCKITNIKIQFMDNTYKTITNSKSIEVPNELKFLISD